MPCYPRWTSVRDRGGCTTSTAFRYLILWSSFDTNSNWYDNFIGQLMLIYRILMYKTFWSMTFIVSLLSESPKKKKKISSLFVFWLSPLDTWCFVSFRLFIRRELTCIFCSHAGVGLGTVASISTLHSRPSLKPWLSSARSSSQRRATRGPVSKGSHLRSTGIPLSITNCVSYKSKWMF